MIRLKNSNLQFLSDFMEHFWKFLVFAIDRVLEINEKSVEKKYEKDIVSLSKKTKKVQEQLVLNTVKFKKIEIDINKRLREAKAEKRKKEEDFSVLRDMYHELNFKIEQKKQRIKSMDLCKDFEKIEDNLNNLNKNVEVAYLENIGQSRMIRNELLGCFMIAMGKNFRTRSKTVACQTDLGMCEFTDLCSVYGIQEHVFKEKDILQNYKHPFLAYIVKKIKNFKLGVPESIRTLEEFLDISIAGAKKGESLVEVLVVNMKKEINNYKIFCYSLSTICKNLVSLSQKGNNYAKSMCKLLGIGGYSMISYSAIIDFLKFRKIIKDTIPGKNISYDTIKEHEISFGSIKRIFNERKGMFYQKGQKFKKTLLGISRFKFNLVAGEMKIDLTKVSNNPFLVSLLNKVQGKDVQDFKDYLDNLFSGITRASDNTSKPIT